MFKIMRHYCQLPRFPWAILYSILVCYERHWQLYRATFDGWGVVGLCFDDGGVDHYSFHFLHSHKKF